MHESGAVRRLAVRVSLWVVDPFLPPVSASSAATRLKGVLR